MACRDVEEAELVGAGGVVDAGLFHRVAGIDQVDEVHALHHAAVLHVEAGDHAHGQHHAAPLGCRDSRASAAAGSMRPSQSARPEITPSMPAPATASRAARSSSEATPPEAITGVAMASA